MRRITLWLLSTAAALVLLFTYRTSTMGPATATAAAAPTPGKGDDTIDGDLVDTQYGPVQVRITVDGRTITDVAAIAQPTGNPQTEKVNAAALPQLRESALAAQSADIDAVSGATYTSTGYRKSLQTAIDKAFS